MHRRVFPGLTAANATRLRSAASPPPPSPPQTEVYGEARERAGAESWLQHLLGTDCYTRAVAELHARCDAMSDEQRIRLAIAFAGCQQRLTRGTAFACRAGRSLKDCVAAMDDDTAKGWRMFYPSIVRWPGAQAG